MRGGEWGATRKTCAGAFTTCASWMLVAPSRFRTIAVLIPAFPYAKAARNLWNWHWSHERELNLNPFWMRNRDFHSYETTYSAAGFEVIFIIDNYRVNYHDILINIS